MASVEDIRANVSTGVDELRIAGRHSALLARFMDGPGSLHEVEEQVDDAILKIGALMAPGDFTLQDAVSEAKASEAAVKRGAEGYFAAFGHNNDAMGESLALLEGGAQDGVVRVNAMLTHAALVLGGLAQVKAALQGYAEAYDGGEQNATGTARLADYLANSGEDYLHNNL